jgi:mRNA interferase RelE/StbE
MAYPVGVERRTQKQVARLSTEMQDRVEAALRALAEELRPPGCRIRIGNVRAIYEIDDANQTVTVLQVAHLRDVYRQG